MKNKNIIIPDSVMLYVTAQLTEDETGHDMDTVLRQAWDELCKEQHEYLDWADVISEWSGGRTSTEPRIEMKNLYDIIDEILTEQEHYDGACGGTDNSCPLCEEEGE